MPPRTGPNGAVVKPSSSTKSQRTARPTASKIIDLTGESSDETSGNDQGESSAEEEDSEDADRHRGLQGRGRGNHNSRAGTQGRILGAGQATVGRPESSDQQRVARRGQEYILEDCFIVTSLHHRPWGAGDDNATIGVFPTEKEAAAAAKVDFLQVSSRADGWESEWRRCPGDGMRQLRGCIEDGEKDIERYTASIKLVQQKRRVTIQASVPSAAQPKPTVVKPRHVYIVKEEQRMNVGEDDPRGFYNHLGDLKAVVIHGIYVGLDAANRFAREICDGIVGDLDGKANTVSDVFKHSIATILVEDYEEMMTYSISVEKRSLRSE